MIQSIKDFIDKHALLSSKSRVILGLSGGPDSLFLLRFLAQLHKEGAIQQPIAAHLDHGWRADSVQDVLFCKEAAQQVGVPFVTAHLSDFAHLLLSKGSPEEIGRQARRLFLEQVMKQHKGNIIALAHHLQDQEETFFIRLIRGTGLTGLCAMWPKHSFYIRPLLETNKRDIVRYLDEHNIAYLTDPSNESPSFLRNRIRKTVLPALREADNRFDHNFLAILTRLQATELYLSNRTKELLQEMVVAFEGKNTLKIPALLAQPLIMQYRILMQWLQEARVAIPLSQQFLDEIIRFLQQPESKTHNLHHQWCLTKKRTLVWVETVA